MAAGGPATASGSQVIYAGLTGVGSSGGNIWVTTNAAGGPGTWIDRTGGILAQAEMPDGERFKTLDTVRGLYDQFVAARLERRSPVLALGGGVLGDTVVST